MSINLQQSHSEGVINEHDKELLKERYIYIYISRRKAKIYWWSKINIIV